MTLPLLIAFFATAVVVLVPLCLPLPRRPRLGEDARFD